MPNGFDRKLNRNHLLYYRMVTINNLASKFIVLRTRIHSMEINWKCSLAVLAPFTHAYRQTQRIVYRVYVYRIVSYWVEVTKRFIAIIWAYNLYYICVCMCVLGLQYWVSLSTSRSRASTLIVLWMSVSVCICQYQYYFRSARMIYRKTFLLSFAQKTFQLNLNNGFFAIIYFGMCVWLCERMPLIKKWNTKKGEKNRRPSFQTKTQPTIQCE